MENVLELMEKRHSVRQYLDKPIKEETAKELETFIKEVNEKSGLEFKLVINEPEAFSGFVPKYGSFRNVSNYIVCSGEKTKDFEEKYGYYGEEIVIKAQSLGLNTCWVGLTVNKKVIKKNLDKDKALGCIISLGYGATQGAFHKNKPVEKVTNVKTPWPEWFKRGMKGAMLAPTAVNSQRFKVSIKDGKVDITASSKGPYSLVDLGIVKYSFEAAAGKEFPGFVQKF